MRVGGLARSGGAGLDVAGDLDALGREPCGLAYCGGDDVDALGQALDDALGNCLGVLRGRGHATKEHVVPGVIIERCDLKTRRQRGTKLGQRLGQAQEDQAVDGDKAKLFTCVIADGLVQATDTLGATVGQGDDLAGKATTSELTSKSLGTLATNGAVVACLGEQAQTLAARGSEASTRPATSSRLLDVTKSMPPSSMSRSSSTTGRRPAAAAIAASFRRRC